MRFPYRAVKAATRRGLAVVCSAFLLWLFVAFHLFVNVGSAPPHRTDAVIMLGGASDDRLPAARKLQQEWGMPVLVLARTGLMGNVAADEVCDNTAFPSSDLVCFRPEPMNTRGEALAISELIDRNHWDSVTVVTSNYHVTRAGKLISQCTTAEVQMVGARASMNPGEWLWRFVVETGGLIDSTLQPEC
ncbi:MAG: hypothetical protein JWQ75_215 [Pseudarthrobacter sp.]|nr:hypothetical protein [Pseudarthrobacter sp.]